MAVHETGAARSYGMISELYANFAAGAFESDPLGRSMIDVLAKSVAASGGGPVLDAGCGPGHVTAYLRGSGVEAFGVDLSEGLVELARTRHGGIRFEVGDIGALEVEGGSLAGVVSNYSIIHSPPERLAVIMAEFARVLAPEGYLMVAFQSHEDPGAGVETFDHQVAMAYRYGVDHVLAEAAAVGLVEQARLVMAPGLDARRGFSQAHLLLRKAGAGL
ncbi:class I SAM-dependent methyltransferase [Nocardiopsis alba]|uniref:class I SAM-dependent DNA methyltransferase n=1 Tax=Nocardiopsis alba TaxID=53437 RepID=UPI0033CA4CF4